MTAQFMLSILLDIMVIAAITMLHAYAVRGGLSKLFAITLTSLLAIIIFWIMPLDRLDQHGFKPTSNNVSYIIEYERSRLIDSQKFAQDKD